MERAPCFTLTAFALAISFFEVFSFECSSA